MGSEGSVPTTLRYDSSGMANRGLEHPNEPENKYSHGQLSERTSAANCLVFLLLDSIEIS